VANTKSAIKRIKVSEKKRLRNRPIRSTARTFVKNARKAVDAGDVQAPQTLEALQQALSYLDRAASKGVIHKNNAARRKSRLMQRFNKAQAAAATTTQS
jgi:small subunit ribosomal protein S20